MPEALETLWIDLPVTAQDALVLLALLLPAVLIGLAVMTGLRPWPLVRAMLWRYRWTNLLFVVLIGVSVGLGVGVVAQERGLRQGTARAAEKFDLVITRPGSEMQMMLASVFLQPVDVDLLDGAVMADVAGNPQVDMAVPLAYGDSFHGQPIIGTTGEFVSYLSGELAEGRLFAAENEAVAGADVDAGLGQHFTPAHGMDADSAEAHEGADVVVVGRMARTGTPWDRSILTPIEGVWAVHGLARGHAPEHADRLGPPFDPDYFPGTPVILVRANQLWANYALKAQYTRADTMAFFPGAVLARLYSVMGDVRQIMSVMAVVTQVLVAASVLACLIILARLFSRRLALLRALGAPRRFVFSVVWGYAAVLVAGGALLGLATGFAATAAISHVMSSRTGVLIAAHLGWREFHQIAGFVSITLILALLPAITSIRRRVVADLRE